jgi:hypothetical protein
MLADWMDEQLNGQLIDERNGGENWRDSNGKNNI